MAEPYSELLKKAFSVLSTEAHALYLRPDVQHLESAISPLEFDRDFVSTNLPVVIKGATRHWPACKKWSLQYFRNTLGDKTVNIAVTPNGYADAIATHHYVNKDGQPCRKEYFVKPEEREMTMNAFLDILEQKTKAHGVFYLQEQNSNLTQSFPELLADVPDHVSWATEAFGSLPDAVNLWIGEKHAVTSMHKDPYENIYCVISGYKDFILHPPTDRPWIPYGNYPVGSYKEVAPGVFEIINETDSDRECSSPTEDCAAQQGKYAAEGNGDRSAVRSSEIPKASPSIDIDKLSTSSINCSSDTSLDLTRCTELIYSQNIAEDTKKEEQTSQFHKQYDKVYGSEGSSFENPTSNFNLMVGSDSEESLKTENGKIPWICIDPLSPDLKKYPFYKNATPVVVRVCAGDVLYLPSLWFHHVRQSHGCIAVNYWYNMNFDIKYAYFRMLESLCDC